MLFDCVNVVIARSLVTTRRLCFARLVGAVVFETLELTFPGHRHVFSSCRHVGIALAFRTSTTRAVVIDVRLECEGAHALAFCRFISGCFACCARTHCDQLDFTNERLSLVMEAAVVRVIGDLMQSRLPHLV